MADHLAILDGDVMDVAQAHIPVTDEGLLRGDGVFEVVRLYNGAPLRPGGAPRADGAQRHDAAPRVRHRRRAR